MDERLLQEKYHIAPTKEGLISAVRHPNADLRSFAALKLAADRQKDVIPALLDALASEAFPGTRVNLASAAAKLGSEDGVVALEGMCQQSAWSPVLRMIAARAMLDVGREECLDGVLTVLRSPTDVQDSVFGLNLLPRFHHLSPAQLGDVRSLIAASLKSPFAPVRMEASYALNELGGAWATEELQGALAVEQEEAVSNFMAATLKSMQAK
jgi:HEAT repeat protein